MASSTSVYVTRLESFILAKASLNLIMDSNCLVVAEMVLVPLPIFLISMYPSTILCPASGVRMGLIYSLA